jgi:hypothetical protein
LSYIMLIMGQWLVRPPMFVGSVGEACCGKECDSNHQFQRSFNHQIFQKKTLHIHRLVVPVGAAWERPLRPRLKPLASSGPIGAGITSPAWLLRGRGISSWACLVVAALRVASSGRLQILYQRRRRSK